MEVKLEAVRLVKSGQEASVTAPCAWGAQADPEQLGAVGRQGTLQGAGERPVSAEQMELARLRTELARVKMERDILKNRPRGLPRPFRVETHSV